MIIRLQAATAEALPTATSSLASLASGWGAEVSEEPAVAQPAEAELSRKGADPVAIASLVLSVPSAALAVQDLADRIRKRRRAEELISHAQNLAAQQVTAHLIVRRSSVEVSTLTPDKLLELIAEDDSGD
jgi:hypothetical protein